jgi:ubiquinone/menaquinone biosynthesis C-methylase UbiE
MSYRLKVIAFSLSAVALLVLAYVGYSAIDTLSRLDAIEADRDLWQRPSDVLEALDAKPGERLVDLGCGSGYFTLKLSSLVGGKGHVIAEDIRWLSLSFLWARTVIRNEHNVTIIHGDQTDPRLPVNLVDALLISNTYHEFADPHAILVHVSRALVASGRLVIVDREPNPGNVGVTENGEHEISVEQVEKDLRQAGFEIVRRQDRFIESDPDHENWWLIVARRP